MVILFDQHNLPDEIYETVFATTQQVIVGRVLIDYLKQQEGEVTKSEMSRFATKLNEGKILTQIQEEPYKGKKVKLSYNKRQFYDRILTPMRSMGLIDYDLYKKTYRISESFSGNLTEIAERWHKEVKKGHTPVSFED